MRERESASGCQPGQREEQGTSQSSDAARIADPRQHYHALSREQRELAIRGMRADGHSDHTIAHATGLAVEQIRQLIGERKGGAE